MKSQLAQRCIFGTAIIFSHMSMGLAGEAILTEHQLCLMTPILVQDYTRNIAENVQKTAENILSLSPDQHTFANTLMAWYQLSTQVKREIQFLKASVETQYFSGGVSEALTDLITFFKETSQNHQLLNILMPCAEKSIEDHGLNPFEQHVAGCFLNSPAHELVLLRGLANEKNDEETDFTFLNLASGHNSMHMSLDVGKKIIAENADIVCISDMDSDDANDLYDELSNDYAYFIYMDRRFSFSEHNALGGMLIASKYPLEKVQSNKLLEEESSNEGFVDFVINNKDVEVGHVYAVNFNNDSSSESQSLKVGRILEKMQDDFLRTEEQIPFFLCGDFSALQREDKSLFLLDAYFLFGANNTSGMQSMLLRSLPSFSGRINMGYTLLTSSLEMPGDRFGLLTIMKKDAPVSNLFINNFGSNYLCANSVILCGHAEVTGAADTKGNSSVEGKVSDTRETDYGTFKSEVDVGVKQDKEGNSSGYVRGSVSWDF